MASECEIRLKVAFGRLVLRGQILETPELNHAVFGDGSHRVEGWQELDSSNDVEVGLERVLFVQVEAFACKRFIFFYDFWVESLSFFVILQISKVRERKTYRFYLRASSFKRRSSSFLVCAIPNEFASFVLSDSANSPCALS